METLLNIFKSKEHEDAFTFAEEDFVFKSDFKRYYIRKINGHVEFWARDEHNTDQDFYLGKVVNERVILARAFYTYPYNVQKGGGRLARIWLHNDDREL